MENIYWGLTFTCITLSAALMFIDCDSRNWLAAFMAFFAAYLGLILLDSQDFYISPALYFLLLPLLFIPGPLLLGYIGHISTRHYIGYKDFVMCLLPTMIVLIAPDLLSDKSIFEYAHIEDYETSTYLALFNLVSAMAGIHILTYVTLSFWLILKLRQDWIHYQSKTLPKSWYKMAQVVAAILIVASLQVLSAFLNPSGNGVSIGDISFILFVLFFIHQAVSTIWSYICGRDHIQDEIILQQPQSDYMAEEPLNTPPAIEKVLIEQAELISEKIIENKLFLQHDLSLTSLARQSSISTHKLSETINTVFDQTFYEYINDFRVDFAAQRLTITPHQSITDIFNEAGFTTKSTFYSYFKKKFNCTPTQYRIQNTAEKTY